MTDENLNSSGNREFISQKKAVIIGISGFLILGFLIGISIYLRTRQVSEEKDHQTYLIANDVKSRIQEALTYSLSATKTLSYFITADGTVNDFDSIAAEILGSTNLIDAVQLVPGGVVKFVYPYSGNESVINYDLLNDSSRNKEAIKAIEKRELFFGGPFNLRQGGQGVVGRLPVFRNGKFWGFTAVVIKLPNLLTAAGVSSTLEKGYYVQLSKVNPDTGIEEYFISPKKSLTGGYSASIDVPNGEWKVSVAPMRENDIGELILFIILGSLFSILGGYLMYSAAMRPQRLNQLVKERTMQLRESEANYKVLFEKSPLPFWIYDLNTLKFLDVNDAAINLYGFSKEEFLQKDVLEIRYKEDIAKFLEQKESGTQDLREAGVWTHLKKNKEPIQVLIFSRNINYKGREGRLVLLMDVSEKVKIESELIQSEEKYRSLIEQASDAIILYSFDGTIHSFNKAAYLQTGYSNEEFESLNLNDVFIDEPKAAARNHRLENKSTSILYRKMRRKDGSIFTVELNARMLPDEKIFAIIRDITEREKIETAMKESEEKFSKAFHTGVVGFAIHDTDQKLVDMNQAYANMIGKSVAELKGRTSEEVGILSLVEPERRAEVLDPILNALFTKGYLHDYEITLPSIDGKAKVLLVSIEKLVLDEKVHWLTSVINVTEKRHAEKQLRESEVKYRSLIEQASDGILIRNTEGTILEANQSMGRLSGYSIEELIGNSTQNFVLPKYLAEFEASITELKEGKSLLREMSFVKKDGSIIDVEVNSRLASANSIIDFVRDISERRKASEELKKSNERFELIAHATNDAVWDHDLEKNETWGNSKLRKLYGFDGGDQKIDLELFLSRIHPDERAGVEQRMDEAIRQSVSSLTEEFRFQVHTGEYRIFYDRAYIKYDERGKPLRILGAMQDITDREKIKKQILKEKELSDTIINSLPGVFYLYNEEGKFKRWNQNFEKVTGYNAEEINYLHPLDLFEGEGKRTIDQKIKNVFEKGSDHAEAEFLLKNGKKVPYYFTGLALEYEGERCLMGVGLDFSDKERARNEIIASETKYRELIEQASDGIFIANQQGNYIDVNSSACKMLGYSKEELLQFNGTDILYTREDINGLPYRYDLLSNGNSSIKETMLRKKNGEPLIVETNSKRLPDGRYISIVRDLSERKEADKAIRESEERYRALVDNAPEALVVFDANRKTFVSVSETAVKLFKYSREELLNLGPLDVSPKFQPDGTLSYDVATKMINEAIAGGKPSFEWTHLDKFGKELSCEIWLAPLPSDKDVLIRGSVIDITARKKAEEDIKTKSELLRELYSYLQNIREEERKHIAREIHDELGQQLTGLKMDLFWINRRLKTDDELIKEKLTAILALIDGTIKAVRKIATELRPSILDDLGLVAALEWQSEEFEKRSPDVSVKFNSKLSDDILVLPNIATAIFRIYQELLTNVARHSKAKHVSASIYVDHNTLYLKVVDDGVGFDAEKITDKKTLGLRGIEERTNLIGGKAEIKSTPGQGTSVLISVPLLITAK